jgi:hypothetical protein
VAMFASTGLNNPPLQRSKAALKLPRIPIPRTWVNKGNKKGREHNPGPLWLRLGATR